MPDVAAAVLDPVGIEHKGGPVGIEAFREHVHDGLAVLQPDELVAVVVVGEFEAVGPHVRRDGVRLFDKTGDLVGIGRMEAADAHEPGPEQLVDAHGLVRVAEHQAEILVRAADFNALLAGDSAEFLEGDRAARRMGIGIAHFADTAEAFADMLRGVHRGADGE